jgi:hypothetical protein
LNFDKFHTLFSTRLSELGYVITSFAQDDFRNTDEYAQNAENVFGFDFLERYHKDGDEFFNYVVSVTDDET